MKIGRFDHKNNLVCGETAVLLGRMSIFSKYHWLASKKLILGKQRARKGLRSAHFVLGMQKGNAIAFPLMSNMLEQLLHVVFALELFNTSAAVDELLLSCKEWVARRANVKPHFRLC